MFQHDFSPMNDAKQPFPKPRSLRSFWALIGVMFQGALSDNIFKFIVMMLILKHANERFPQSPSDATALGNTWTSIAEGAFILPFIVSATIAGWLSDRFAKSRVTLWTKILEIIVMAAGMAMFALGYISGAIIVLFFMGFQSALFSPSKYGILPEILPEEQTAWGNGILQGGTFLAIILGTILGPSLFQCFNQSLWINGLILVGLAGGGALLALQMAPTPVGNPAQRFEINPVPMVSLYGREILSNTGILWGVVGMSVWWMAGVMMQGAALLIAVQVLGLSPSQTGLALLPIVVGMGAGCVLAGMVSKNRIELGLVPFGALAMFSASMLVWRLTPNFAELSRMSSEQLQHIRYIVPAMMGLVGLVCGFFIVPLQAFVIQETRPDKRGGVWSVSNVFTSIGMMAGAGARGLIVQATASPGDVFFAGGVLMLLTGIVICVKFPRIPLRFLAVVLFKMIYRVNVKGAENIPAKGGALITSNHQSYIDALLLSVVIERPVRFIMTEDLYRKWFIYPFARITNTIPIKGLGSVRDLIKALREAREEIRQGGLVCIFPEGQMTRLGMMLPFRRGFEHIMRGIQEPIIPAAIDGAYETIFALPGGRRKPIFFNPRAKKPVLCVVFGKPMPADTKHPQLRVAIMDLMVDAFAIRKERALPLHLEAVNTLRNGSFAQYKMLAGTIALGRKLRRKWQDDENIGILLPPSAGAAATNLAATWSGRIPINLNYTAAAAVIEEICANAGIRLIITSRLFMKKIKIALPAKCDIVYLEDIRNEISFWDTSKAFFHIFIRQKTNSFDKLLGRKKSASMDDVATIIFSSGSTGTPKGVELTHWNIWANVASAYHMVDFPPDGCLLGILPFFHSFGNTVALWLPMLTGFRVIYHPNPLHGREIGELVQKHKITHLFATPTILNIYTRRVQPEQFGSLRMALTGAEKLRANVSEAFEKRFGIRPIEGYGATECSPIVCLNTLDFRQPSFYQKGVKYGTVGHPAPGVTVRVVDPETGAPLGVNEPGMLHVRGHNIMHGYYHLPEKTAEVMKDGWYVTGDIAQIDEEGFITITDRLSRFSKIGGEMAPHIRIEETLHNAIGATDMIFAVTGVPDEKKGERLVVLYAAREEKARRAAEEIQNMGLPPLWIPKWSDFFRVEALPILGTGKLDLRAIKAMALSLAGAKK